jgi:predicted nucleic acid-binding protein
LKNKGILPDTCAWIDYFRPEGDALGQLVERAIASDSVYVCGPVLYELIQGARSEKERVSLTSALGALPYLEMTEAIWIKAGQLSAALRKAGKTIPLSDILIATLAIEHNLAVMTVDVHFRNIPGVLIDVSAAHLLRSPKNARRLFQALARAQSRTEKPQTLETLKKGICLGEKR